MDVKQDVTKMSISKPELLAPAGDMEKLRLAVLYGADAVYLGASDFSLRAQAHNFDANWRRRWILPMPVGLRFIWRLMFMRMSSTCRLCASFCRRRRSGVWTRLLLPTPAFSG